MNLEMEQQLSPPPQPGPVQRIANGHKPLGDQAAEQVAAIMARGAKRYLLRLRRSQPCPEKESTEFSPAGLEVSDDPRLSVSRRIGV